MKRALKITGLILLLPVLAVLAFVLWAGGRAVLNEAGDDPDHIASKSAYLREIAATAIGRRTTQRPNILIIYYDDLGYGDLGFTGSKAIRTPNIDALARDGVVLSNYHSPSPVCSPSRAGLLTGRLPPRAAVPDVLHPSDSPIRLINYATGFANRLPAEEITMADVLKADGFRTGMIGKWHLGDIAPSLPGNFGFDSFYGAHYSNDMAPFALYRGDRVEVAAPADQTQLNESYTREAQKFIAAQQPTAAPFFLYFAHNFPHQPLFVPKAQAGRSAAGLYGDVIEGLDDGVGHIVETLKQTGQYDNTIIILTSDNGPWYQGSSGQQRGRKGQTFEGGMRVPFLIHWPAGVAGNRTVSAMAMGTDIMPTLFDWLGLPLPKDRKIDGSSLRALLEGKSGSAHAITYFYASTELMAVSDGRFKYHAAQPYSYVISNSRIAVPSTQGPWLFDLSVDPDESYDVATKYPETAAKLEAALNAKNEETKANPRGWVSEAQ